MLMWCCLAFAAGTCFGAGIVCLIVMAMRQEMVRRLEERAWLKRG
jgi:hypothetical protein